MKVEIRKARKGDENTLACIQIQSWKAGFADILDEEILSQCTDMEKMTAMYTSLLDTNRANGYILSVEHTPHCMAWWAQARDTAFAGKAELICIHSLPDNWHKGYGRTMMEYILKDIQKEGYTQIVLWVFQDNTRARCFYESLGFVQTSVSKSSFHTKEILYIKNI